MEAPEDFEALKRRLIEMEPMLPKRLRQTAAFALEHPDEIALGTASGSPSAPRCRLPPWFDSPRRSVLRVSRICRACSVRICARAGPIIPNV